MSAFILSIAILGATTVLSESPCQLSSSSVLAPYGHATTATGREWRDSRLTLEQFMSCSPTAVDQTSRRLFFDVVVKEFTTDHTYEITRWSTEHPQATEGVDTAISSVQTHLRKFMEGLVDRKDPSTKEVILRYGTARAISLLGPSVKQDVVAMLGNSVSFYGLSGRYSTQEEAVGALGYWIDPDNHDFSPTQKAELTQILTALLPNVRSGLGSYEQRFFHTTLSALAHSDSGEAEAALEKWIDSQQDHRDPLVLHASKALTTIQHRRHS